MTCSDWEFEIASESESPELADHLKDCVSCREFAQEMAANRAALASLPVDAAALDAVRSRVLGELTRGRGRAIPAWAWTAAACLAVLGIAGALWIVQGPVAPPPAVTARGPAVLSPAPPVVPVRAVQPPKRAHPRRLVARQVEPPSEPLVVKMLTDDPSVVIVWLVSKKGDSL
jgi:hypothetical protein